ncbi:MAG TPA: hypothetical protein VID72_13490 [Ktedonobacterales bacterium]
MQDRAPTQPDSRMPPWRWWLMTLAMALGFGVFCLVTHSWSPLRAGWPILALILALAVIRQGADLLRTPRTPRRPTGEAKRAT